MRPADASPGWVDVSVMLRSGMPHWPDNPPVRIERQQDIDRGDVANVSTISMGAHTGTHMDAPLHFIGDGKGLEEMDLDATVGRARVVGIDDTTVIRRAELERCNLQAGERVLFKTINSEGLWTTDAFVEDFVYVSEEAALYLVSREVRTVGIDYLSVGGFEHDAVETHRALLEAGIWVIEGLDLGAVEPGDYDLVCLPLRIDRSDGAPARAILRAV
ncbi:cyclase family protein [soil metagenome]